MATRNRIIDKLDDLEPELAQAFRDAVRQIRSRARLARLEAAIDRGDFQAAIRAAGIDRSAAVWALVTEQMRQAYIEGGRFFQSEAPARFGFVFDMNNPRAEAWLRANSSRLITEISDDQREAVRVGLEAGSRRGDNPRRTALNLVGRIGQSGRREGGIVGLTSRQAQAVENARDELLAGDSAYFQRKRRDKRFDGLLRRAIARGEGLSEATPTGLLPDTVTACYSSAAKPSPGPRR